MIIDAFLARNEIELVLFRARYLSGNVDKFLVGESRFTFSGSSKPLLFHDLKLKGKLPAEVDVIEIKFPPDLLESRDKTKMGDFAHLELLRMAIELCPESKIFFGDVDEIPSLEQVQSAARLGSGPIFMSVPMRMFYRRVNWELARRKSRLWTCPKLISGIPPTWAIRSTRAPNLPGSPGAHFSFLETSNFSMSEKMDNYEHEDLNKSHLSERKFLDICDSYGLDHFLRSQDEGLGLLRFVDPRENDVVREASIFRPTWRGANFRFNLLERLALGQLISRSHGRVPQLNPVDGATMKLKRLHLALGLLNLLGTVANLVVSRSQRIVSRKIRRFSRLIRRALSLRINLGG